MELRKLRYGGSNRVGLSPAVRKESRMRVGLLITLALATAGLPAGVRGHTVPGRPEATFPVAEDPPTEWVEATGHRVIRLSREPGSSTFISTRTATRPPAIKWSS